MYGHFTRYVHCSRECLQPYLEGKIFSHECLAGLTVDLPALPKSKKVSAADDKLNIEEKTNLMRSLMDLKLRPTASPGKKILKVS